MRPGAFCCLLSLLSGAEAFGEELQTRFGSLVVTRTGDWSQALSLDGAIVPGTEAAYLHPEQVIRWREDVDVAIVFQATGGTACPGYFQFVTITADGRASASEAVGSCSDVLDEVRTSPLSIEIDMPSLNPTIAKVTVRFDGISARAISVVRNEIGAEPAGAGADVTRWHGTHPFDVLKDPAERLRFRTIMQEATVYELMELIGVAGPAEVEGGFLFGRGCKPHDCGFSEAGFAIEVATGRPFAVLKTEVEGTRVLGGELDDLPPSLREFAVETSF